jgi:hypothetical protein
MNQTKAQRNAHGLAAAYGAWEVAKQIGLAQPTLAITAGSLFHWQKETGVFMVDQVSLQRALAGELPTGWPTSPTLSALAEALKAGTVIQSQVLETLHAADPTMENNAGTIEAARFTYESDEIEIDDSPLLSEADNGCWVSAWVWVANSEATWARPFHPLDNPSAARPAEFETASCITTGQHRDTGRGVCCDCGAAL